MAEAQEGWGVTATLRAVSMQPTRDAGPWAVSPRASRTGPPQPPPHCTHVPRASPRRASVPSRLGWGWALGPWATGCLQHYLTSGKLGGGYSEAEEPAFPKVSVAHIHVPTTGAALCVALDLDQHRVLSSVVRN